ncbi:MAG: MotA/TolQ/ExbB proton channel family protein [Thermodesulfobacteriota bacterium]|nr:MotA/TolQ/ExbB proton channel family protein [Thermodesulfobacteriota bacterium]
MDLATIAGILSAFSLIFISITLGAGIGVFINIPSLCIVVGGTIGATLINYPLKDFLGVVKIVKNSFMVKNLNPQEIIMKLVDFSKKAKREGLLSLENVIEEEKDEFFKKGLTLCVDGLEPKSIENILQKDIEKVEDRHKLGADILTSMGTFAPAMGLIGTLIGLVQMLQNMDDPGSIGPAMAVALLTTFYGAVMANVMFLPIAGKLQKRSAEEMLTREVMVEGIMAVSQGESPRIIEERLVVYLTPSLRQVVRDNKEEAK